MFAAKGLVTHSRKCVNARPPRPLVTIEKTLGKVMDLEGLEGSGAREGIDADGEPNGTSLENEVEGRGSELVNPPPPRPCFLPPLIATERRSNMMSQPMIPRSTTPGSLAAQAL